MKKIYLFALLSLSIQLVSAQNFNMDLVGQLDYSEKLNDVWGYVDSLGNEYALVGTNTPGGVSVVDLSDPANPVEVAFVDDVASLWRDMKSWGTHAYATNEAGGGLLIIDLSSLPDASGITSTRYTGPAGNSWSSAHNLFIDEFGYAYIFGASRGNGGAIILDLADPENPEEVGTYETAYIHDGMAKNNILYTGNIYLGTFSIVDVSDKSNPVYLGGHETPSEFTHNIWVSDDGNYVYTTDEVSGGYIAGYDISDLNDIVETDKARVTPNTSITVHNAHFMNEYVITSYYDAGVTIHDVSDPENMILTGHYDTAPNNSSGFGAWGAYPFLPSGLVLASDNAEGLFVLQPIYTRAARIEGQITDAITGNAIFNAEVRILSTDAEDGSDVSGEYKTGVAEAGTYSVKITKGGYPDTTITGLEFINGETLTLNVSLSDGTVGINELYKGAEFKVFPNPSSDEFYVEIDNKTNGELKEIYILNLSGQRVYTQNVSSNNADRIAVEHHLENGTYILNLLWEDQRISVSKVLIAK
jgi:choice-of-anchor B domain-containing protein